MNILKEKSKTETIANIISRQITQGYIRPGSKLASIRHLAAEFSVSNKVVELAFNILEKQNLIYKEPGRGMYVKEPERQKPSEIIGLLTQFSTNTYEEFFDSATLAFSKNKKLCVPCRWAKNDDNSLTTLEMLMEQKPEGIIIYVPFYEPIDRILSVIGSTPCCFINYRLEDTCRPAVFTDYVAGFQKALEFLFIRGHKKVLIAGHNEELLEEHSDRLQKACRNIGKEFPSDSIIYASSTDLDDDQNKRIKSIFTASDKPTAIIGFSDYVCWRFIETIETLYPGCAFQEKIGFYNTKWSQQKGHEFHSLSPDYAKIIDLAINRIINPDSNNDRIEWIEPTLIIRENNQ